MTDATPPSTPTQPLRLVDSGPGDPLGDAVSEAFLSLARSDLAALEERAAPHRHEARSRLLLRLAGRDPRCTPADDLGASVVVILGFVFTLGWQVTAVVIAARYDLRSGLPLPTLMAIGLGVGFAVVLFDWHMIQGHITGSTDRKMWAVRLLFTACMVFLVSEAAATAIFDKDIQAQNERDNRGGSQQLNELLAANQAEIEKWQARIAALDGAVNVAADKATQADQEMVREDEGLNRPGGKGARYKLARQAKELAEQELAQATGARDDKATGVAAAEQRISELRLAAPGLEKTVDIVPFEKLGPGQREAALWQYMIDHPSALLMKRLPLFVILVCLDMFALLIGIAASRRVKEEHRAWSQEQLELSRDARAVRARILEDAKGVIGRLVRDGMRGEAEERAVRERWRRAMRTSREFSEDFEAYESDMARRGFPVEWSRDYSRFTGAVPQMPGDAETATRSHSEPPRAPKPAGTAGGVRPPRSPATLIDLAADEGRTRPTGVRAAPAGGSVQADAGPAGPLNGAPPVRAASPAATLKSAQHQFTLPTPRRMNFSPATDPARQRDEDLAPFLDVYYPIGTGDVLTAAPLVTDSQVASTRATLLLGKGRNDDRRYVVKVFALAGGRGTYQTTSDELSRDATNAKRMTDVTGSLGMTAPKHPLLVPASFGMNLINGRQVPYLVTPYCPSGSILEFLADHTSRLTLGWCLAVSEQMFRACAALAEQNVVGCDAKLANFVFTPGQHESTLTSEALDEIRRAGEPDVSRPIVGMIDLSMVYMPGRDAVRDRGTRAHRGTLGWSSPRALGGGQSDDRPFPLTSLDDAFSVAVNTMYLFTERRPPFVWGSRVPLEKLAGQSDAAAESLRELSLALAVLADDTSIGPRGEHLLPKALAWLGGRGIGEADTCAALAGYIGDLRQSLPVDVTRKELRRMQFVSLTEEDQARLSGPR